MSMMKDMYNSGDDNMRKIIGESMMKVSESVKGFESRALCSSPRSSLRSLTSLHSLQSQRGEKLDVDGMKDM